MTGSFQRFCGGGLATPAPAKVVFATSIASIPSWHTGWPLADGRGRERGDRSAAWGPSTEHPASKSHNQYGDYAMKTETDANVKSERSQEKPYAMLGAGDLTASLWKSGDERSGWHYYFNIYRTSSRNGHVSQLFSPKDVVDLVKLAQVLAFALSDDGCLDTETRDDLACLSGCLDDVLPRKCDAVDRPPRTSARVVAVLRKIIEWHLATDERHFAAHPYADHAYRLMLFVDRWLDGVELSQNEPVVDVDMNNVDSTTGVCPICGQHDGYVNFGDYHWYYCQAHQTRWCVGYNRLTPEVYEDSVSYRENWERIGHYRVVEPICRLVQFDPPGI